ncbi:hypothetical protein HPS57_05545 [Prevotella sp. PINT]|jgi:hypothetical protein|uniref:hypothetical protein n=1 Tax=Palleniella intestinalis TaxID=2736291 RepID=UPI00155763DE|nr:hypothetical protein [Palleniella intestinalis]NPD81433.1 hypothetical protein [Palleniella intestinalis]
MKKIFLCLVALLTFFPNLSIDAMAQEGESPSKTINKIKRDGSYVYAEATAKTREEAAEAAKQLLLIEISQYVATKKKFSGADQVLIKDMQTESQSIEMPRGDMTRVFLYVKKNDLIAAETVEAVNQKTLNAITPRPEPKKVKEEKKAAPARKEEVAETVTHKVLTVNDPSLKDWQKKLVQDVMDRQEFHKVKLALNKYKSQYKVKRLGSNETSCPNPSEAFYVVFGNGGSITQFISADTGSGRIDYVSGKSADARGIESKKHVWFTLSK